MNKDKNKSNSYNIGKENIQSVEYEREEEYMNDINNYTQK